MLLDHSNYPAWRVYIRKRLEDEGLWAITTGTEARQNPDRSNSELEIEECKKKSRLAFYLLIKSIDDSVIFSVSALDFENNPSQLWKVLQSNYQPNDLHSKFEAFVNFRSIRFDPNQPQQFIDAIRHSFLELDLVGFNFDETTWMVFFLSQLPLDLAHSILSSPAQSQQDAGSESVPRTTCEDLFERLRSFSIQPPSSNQHDYHQKPQDDRSASDPNHSNTTVLSCRKCNRKGHTVDRCWLAHPELNPYKNKSNLGSSPNGSFSASQNGQPYNKYKNQTSTGPHSYHPPPHQSFHRNSNHEGQSDRSPNADWNKPYNNNKNFGRKKEYPAQSDDNFRGYNKNRDYGHHQNGNENRTFKKPLHVQKDWALESARQNHNKDQSGGEGGEETTTGWNNNNADYNDNLVVPESGWRTSENLLETKLGSGTGWTENVADFETLDNPPNQWTGLDDPI